MDAFPAAWLAAARAEVVVEVKHFPCIGQNLKAYQIIFMSFSMQQTFFYDENHVRAALILVFNFSSSS